MIRPDASREGRERGRAKGEGVRTARGTANSFRIRDTVRVFEN